MEIELVDVEKQILQEINDKRFTRDDIAVTYAFGLNSDERIDWVYVNTAIVERRSMNALDYIKTKAWKLKGEK